jgi:O-antigen/teichoic acid export membrane protein
MKMPADISGKALARNTILNFAGQIFPLIIGVVTIPLIIKGLGTERFGILALIWVVLGYFSLFDMGLGRATTKFVSELLGKKEIDRLTTVVWTSLLFNTLLGIIGGVVLAAITSPLAEHIFNIPPSLIGETKTTLYILSLCVPIVVIILGLRGILEGLQRFDLVNAVKAPSSALIFLIPALVVPFGFGLKEIVILLLVFRMGSALAYFLFCVKSIPALKYSFSIEKKLLLSLLAFGGWVAVSNVIAPIVVYLDRFLIGAILTMDAVSYYSAPYEIVTRLWILPLSVVITLFPVFSSFKETKKDETGNIYALSVKYLFLLMGPLLLIIAIFAKDILQIWLGLNFAERSTQVLQILCLGVFINSLAHVPFTFIQGIGRPDLTAKFHLLETPVFAGMAWILIHKFGITGAALAWTLRVTIDALLLFGASFRKLPDNLASLIKNGFFKAGPVFIGFTSGAILGARHFPNLKLKAAVIAGLTIIFVVVSWKYVLDSKERTTIRNFLNLTGKSRA